MARRNRIAQQLARLVTEVVAFSITLILAIFAADGAALVWPDHPSIGRIFAVLCAIAAGIGHIRFRAQCDIPRTAQTRLLIGAIVLLFGLTSVVLGSMSAYRQIYQPLQLPALPSIDSASHPLNMIDGVTHPYSILTGTPRPLPKVLAEQELRSMTLVETFFQDLLAGSLDAVVPFCIGCFLELLPLATLFLMESHTS